MQREAAKGCGRSLRSWLHFGSLDDRRRAQAGRQEEFSTQRRSEEDETVQRNQLKERSSASLLATWALAVLQALPGSYSAPHRHLQAAGAGAGIAFLLSLDSLGLHSLSVTTVRLAIKYAED